MAINSVILMGRLTAEPEIKSTQNGIEVCNFSLAVDKNYQNKDGEKKANFIDCTAWRQTAVFINKYFHKGSMIAIVGELSTDKYTDKDGNSRKKTEVVVNTASFCGSKSDTDASYNSSVNINAEVETAQEIPSEDDLPF